MCERDERHVDAGHQSDLGGKHAPGVDDQVGGDVARVGHDPAHAPVFDVDSGDARGFANLRAATSGALYERECQLARIDVAIGREQRRAEDSVGRHGRKHALSLFGRDQLEGQSEGLGPGGLARELLHPLLARRESQRADLMPAGLEPDLVFQGSVEIDRVHHHPGQAERASELTDQSGRMERRAAGYSRALDEDRVGPAKAREPVQDGRAADTTSDDDGAGVLPQTL